MPSDTPERAPALTPDPPAAPVVEPVPATPASIVPLDAVAPSLAAVAVVQQPVTTAAPGADSDRSVVDALERLRDALVSAGDCLDRVVATIPDSGAARPSAP